MKSLPVILSLVLFCFAQVNFAQDKKALSPEEVKKIQAGIKTANEATNSISSHFTQEKNMSFLAEVVKSSGMFYYLKKAKIRWEYKEPSPYTAVISEGKIYVNDGTNKNTFDTRSQKGFKELNDMMIQCINGSIADNENYKVNYYSTTKNYVVSLEPKSKNLKAFVVKIELYIDKVNYSVEAIRLTESSEGDYTHIRFEDRKFNEHLDPALFSGF